MASFYQDDEDYHWQWSSSHYDHHHDTNDAHAPYYHHPYHSLDDSRFLQEQQANATAFQINQSFNDAATLKNTLRLYGILFLVVLVVFCWLRQKYPRVYNLRDWVDDISTPLAKKQYGYLSWMYKLYLLSDTEVLDECGMDALCYTRVLELGVKLAAMGILVSLVLIPTYVTAPVGPETQGIEDIVVRMSTTNVPSGDLRFLATVLGAYVIFGYAMYNILYEFEWFYMMRYQFLKKTLPRNYTVYVRCIPEDFSSQTQLRRYFERFARMGDIHNVYSMTGGTPTAAQSPQQQQQQYNGVLASTIALETPNLKKKVAEREKVLEQLEHAINIEDVKGTIPVDRSTGQSKVDTLWDQLDGLNDEITCMIESIEDMQQTEDKEEVERLLQEVAEEQSIAEASVSAGTPSPKRKSNAPTTIGEEYYDSLDEKEEGDDDNGDDNDEQNDNSGSGSKVNESKHSASSAAKLFGSFASRTVGAAANTVTKTANVAANTVQKTANVAATTVQKTANVAASATTGAVKGVVNLFSSEDGKPMTAGFVSFTNLTATHAAMQMIQYPQPFAMEVLEAPSPNDIFWTNVGKKHKDLQVGKLISFSLTTALCLFWTVPMSFIATLSTIEGLREIDWINKVLEALPWLEPVLAQLAPLLIVVANVLLKIILQYCCTFEGPISGAVIQASLFAKLSVFMIIQTFFVSAVSGSLAGIVSQFREFAEDTSLIIDLLATSLPNQSTYFIQILIVDTAISLSVELLRVVAVAQATVRALVGPNLTEKERETAWLGIRPLADPAEFEHSDLMSITVLYYVVYFVYAVLAPIVSVFMFICFLLIGAAYRHQFVYIYPTKPDSGGALYVQFMKLVPSCILIGEVTIAGSLALKKTPIASALLIPLLVITVLFVIYLGQQHFKMAKFLSARQCMDTDRKNQNTAGGAPLDLDFIKGQYIQPEMREKKKYPENASLARQKARGMIQTDVLKQQQSEETFSFSVDGAASSTHSSYQRGALESILGSRSSANGNN